MLLQAHKQCLGSYAVVIRGDRVRALQVLRFDDLDAERHVLDVRSDRLDIFKFKAMFKAIGRH